MVSNGTNLIVSQSNFTRNNGTNGGAIYFEVRLQLQCSV